MATWQTFREKEIEKLHGELRDLLIYIPIFIIIIIYRKGKKIGILENKLICTFITYIEL